MLAVLLGVLAVILVVIHLLQPCYFSRMVERMQGLLPPGPFSWPIIGAVGIVEDAPWETLTTWAAKYGPVNSFFYGSEYTIVLSGSDVIKAAMKNPAFDGRPLNHSSKLYFSKGIAFAEGELWKKHRRLVVTSVRALARGISEERSVFDGHLQACARKLVDTLREQSSVPVDPATLLHRAVADVMSFLIFKDSLSSDDGKFEEMLQSCKKIFSLNPSTDILNIFPWLRNLPPFKKQHDFFAKAHQDMFKIVSDVFIDKKREFEKWNENGQEGRNFTEAMLMEQTHQTKAILPDQQLTDEEIKVMCAENYLAGTEDTWIVFRWTLLVLLLFPNVQRKLQVHIEEIVGRSRAPVVTDKSALTYLEAVLYETMRWSSSTQFPLPHRILQDTFFMGFKLPKDSAVIVNAFAVNRSADCWADPLEFQAERFLTKDGKLNPISCSKFLGFGEGRRNCPGQAVAKITLLILLGSIVQKFNIIRPPGQSLPQITRSNGTASQPPDFQVIFQSRTT